MHGLESFLSAYRLRRLSKGEIIIHQNDPPSTVYCIHSGIVKLYDLTPQGEERPIEFLQANELFPIDWVFSQHHSSYYYEALTDCRLYAVPHQDYLELIKTNREAAFELATSLARSRSIHNRQVTALVQSKAATKVAYTMNYLADSFGEPTKDGQVSIAIPLSQHDLANLMGLTRETTSIELKKLERKEIIVYEYPHYIVNAAKLQDELNMVAKTTKPRADYAQATPENAYAKTNN